MSSASIGLSVLAVCKLEKSIEIEKEIKSLGSIKQFAEVCKDNNECIEAYLDSIDPDRQQIEDDLGRHRCSGNRFKIA